MKYKNITFSQTNYGQEYTGSMDFQAKEEDWQAFLDYNDGSIEHLDEEEKVEMCDGSLCGSYNADVFILFMNWMLDQEKEFEIEYHGKMFWLCHDISHAINDVSGGTIYPSGFAENRANQFSIDLMKENGIEFDLSLEEVIEFSYEFKARFREDCIIDEDFYYSYFEEEFEF